MSKKNQYEDRLVKTVGDQEKINMTPIVENVTKLVGAIMIVLIFVVFSKMFYAGSVFGFLFSKNSLYVPFWDNILNNNFVVKGIIGHGDRWAFATVWTIMFFLFGTAMVSYIVFYIKDLIALIEAIVKTTGKIGHSITDTLKESDLWKEDMMGRTRRKKMAEKKKYYYEEEAYDGGEEDNDEDEYEERLIQPRIKKAKLIEETVKEKKPRRVLYDDVDDVDDEEIEELESKFNEIKEREETKKELKEYKKEEVREEKKDKYSDLSDEDLDNLLKGE